MTESKHCRVNEASPLCLGKIIILQTANGAIITYTSMYEDMVPKITQIPGKKIGLKAIEISRSVELTIAKTLGANKKDYVFQSSSIHVCNDGFGLCCIGDRHRYNLNDSDARI